MSLFVPIGDKTHLLVDHRGNEELVWRTLHGLRRGNNSAERWK